MTTDEAVQHSLAEKVRTFLGGLSREEAALFAASVAGGLQPGEGFEDETVEVQGYGSLPLTTSALVPSFPPQLRPQCSWQVVAPGQMCYVCGSVRVQCVFIS